MISSYKTLNRVLVAGTAIAIALLYLFPLFARTTNNPSYYLQIVSVALCSAILTISLNICMGYGGLMSLMHTGLQMMGGYAVAILTLNHHWNGWLALVMAIVVGAVFAVLVILLSLRATYLYFGMITLAVNLIAMEAIRQGGSFTGGYNGLIGVMAPGITTTMMTPQAFYVLLVYSWSLR